MKKILTEEAREHMVAATRALSSARDADQAAWHQLPSDERGDHQQSAWWALNEMTLSLFAALLRHSPETPHSRQPDHRA